MSATIKIAVAGATGRVGGPLVEALRARGGEVVAIARSTGVDVITGEGLAEALDGVDVIVDAATSPSPDQREATTFFTTAIRNLHEIGRRAGVRRMVVVSIIGVDRFTVGYNAAKLAHEQAAVAGPVPVRILRSARSSTSWCPCSSAGERQGDVSYVQEMRTQLVVASAVAEVLADLATADDALWSAPSTQAPMLEVAGPGEESMVAMATLLASRRGEPLKIEGVDNQTDPDHELYTTDMLLPGPSATLAGPDVRGVARQPAVTRQRAPGSNCSTERTGANTSPCSSTRSNTSVHRSSGARWPRRPPPRPRPRLLAWTPWAWAGSQRIRRDGRLVRSFWLQSTKTLPLRSAFVIDVNTRAGSCFSNSARPPRRTALRRRVSTAC